MAATAADKHAAQTIQKLLKDKNIIDIISFSENPRDTCYLIISDSNKSLSELGIRDKSIFSIAKPSDIITKPGILKGMLEAGNSTRLKKSLSKHFGFEKYTSFDYNLLNLPAVRKQIFSHSLYGTGGRESFLKKLGGERFGKNNVIVPSAKAAEMADFFKTWNVQYERKDIWTESK